MRKKSVPLICSAGTIAVIGGISRLMVRPFFVESRVWAGVAIVLLLISIAINTLPKEQ
jgi:hypothetical protein